MKHEELFKLFINRVEDCSRMAFSLCLQMAERCGINAIITNPSLGRIMNKYWHETGGKIKFISDCGVKEGFLEGIRIETVQECVKQGIKPDFWVKTLHEHNYWSAVLAAGAIQPTNGFKYAFDNGADFICVGRYDFQIVEDCNIALNSLANNRRTRPWRG